MPALRPLRRVIAPLTVLIVAMAFLQPMPALATAGGAATSASAASTMTNVTAAAPANGDGFLFSSGVQATLVNRVVRLAPDVPLSIRSAVGEVVRQINASSGAGVVIGADTTAPPGTTEIAIRAPSVTVCGANAAGCTSNAVATVDGLGVAVNAIVEIDRDLVGTGYELPILLHEIAHAMGLGHFDQPYDGQMQVMWNSVSTDMTSYRTGDRNGLAALGAAFTNRNVTGTIDRVDPVPGGMRVRGWALDPDAPTLALPLAISLGSKRMTGVANAYRPDVGAAYPSAGPNHGIDLVIPTSGLEGPMDLCVVATGGQGQDVGIGCRATTVTHSPLGSLDLARQRGPGAIEASGWAFDPDRIDATTVELTIDGATRSTTPTNQTRTDIARTYPGFPGPRGWTSVVTGIAPGSHRVCARALDLSGDAPRVLGCRTVTVAAGDPFGAVEAIAPSAETPLVVRGWSIDPDTTSPVTVHLYVDGRFSRTATAGWNRPDVGLAHPGYGDAHGFAVALPAMAPGTHRACVFAINQLAGATNTLLGCRDFVAAGAAPIGNVDVVDTVDGRRSIIGWTLDPDTIDPIAVHVWADGRYLGAGPASRQRPDIRRAYPAYGAAHGFAIPVDQLSAGTHQVCAYGINAGTVGPNPLLGCRTIEVAANY